MTRKKSTKINEKSETLTIRLRPKDKEFIERLAAKDGLSISDYVLSTVVGEFLLCGDPEVMAYAVGRVCHGMSLSVKDKFTQFLSSQNHGDETPA